MLHHIHIHDQACHIHLGLNAKTKYGNQISCVGEILREDVIKALGLSVTEAAKRLNMSRNSLARVLNERAAISPDLAIRLGQAGVSTARAWLTMQMNYNLAQALQRQQPPVQALQVSE